MADMTTKVLCLVVRLLARALKIDLAEDIDFEGLERMIDLEAERMELV